MKDVEIFFFDVDGTLLNNHNHTISKATSNALIDLKSKGYKVALCTGRNYEGIKDLGLLELIEWDAFVLANGSQILDSNLELVDEILFDPSLLHRLDAQVSGPLLVEGDINFITKEPNAKFLAAKEHFGTEELTVRNYQDDRVYNIICYNFDEIENELLEEVQAKCQFFHDQLGNMEIIPLKSGKHNGVARVNQLLGTSRYAAFGDGENDVEFLKHAPISVAMGNGTDNVKKVSGYITESVDQDGIIKALQHFGVL